jgi:formylglycine-generating enzyme required for sulfatase activity
LNNRSILLGSKNFAMAVAVVMLAGCVTEPLPDQVECSGVTLLRVPEGKRLIGSNSSRAGKEEQPACIVEFVRPFYMSQTEVTERQYETVMQVELDRRVAGPTHPLQLTWMEAAAFCEAFEALLEQQTGHEWTCRLPYEAEWEYAACYGRPPWEDWWPETPSVPVFNDPREYCWYGPNSDGNLHPVATRKPNPLGLYDMLGNAEEWCGGRPTDSVPAMLSIGWKASSEQGRHMRPSRGGHYLVCEERIRPSYRSESHVMDGGCIRVLALPYAEDPDVCPWEWQPVLETVLPAHLPAPAYDDMPFWPGLADQKRTELLGDLQERDYPEEQVEADVPEEDVQH